VSPGMGLRASALEAGVSVVSVTPALSARSSQK
jgi:hypothetical protein